MDRFLPTGGILSLIARRPSPASSPVSACTHSRIAAALIPIVLLLAPAVAYQAQGQDVEVQTAPEPQDPILITDLLKLQRLGSVRVSPDGREVVVRLVRKGARFRY